MVSVTWVFLICNFFVKTFQLIPYPSSPKSPQTNPFFAKINYFLPKYTPFLTNPESLNQVTTFLGPFGTTRTKEVFLGWIQLYSLLFGDDEVGAIIELAEIGN